MFILLQGHNLPTKPQHLADSPEQNLPVQVESDPCRNQSSLVFLCLWFLANKYCIEEMCCTMREVEQSN